MNYYESDLAKLIMNSSIHFNKETRKNILYQIAKALQFLNQNFIIHRDMKPSNILVNKQGQIVLTDFGLARHLVYKDRELSKGVITRWYRPPEILFGAKFYSNKIDIWSLGCIFAELFLKQPIFPGDSDMNQLSKIFGILGTPNSETWPDVNKLPNYLSFVNTEPISLQNLISEASQEEIELIQEMLSIDPNKRISIDDLLNKNYFKDVQNFDAQDLGNLIDKLGTNQYIIFITLNKKLDKNFYQKYFFVLNQKNQQKLKEKRVLINSLQIIKNEEFEKANKINRSIRTTINNKDK